MNLELLEATRNRVPSIPVLINMVSLRVRQLNAGARPYVKRLSKDEEKVDIALREIMEGKLTAEIELKAPPEDSSAKTNLAV